MRADNISAIQGAAERGSETGRKEMSKREVQRAWRVWRKRAGGPSGTARQGGATDS